MCLYEQFVVENGERKIRRILSWIKRICDENPSLSRRRSAIQKEVTQAPVEEFWDRKTDLTDRAQAITDEFFKLGSKPRGKDKKLYQLALLNIDDETLRKRTQG